MRAGEELECVHTGGASGDGKPEDKERNDAFLWLGEKKRRGKKTRALQRLAVVALVEMAGGFFCPHPVVVGADMQIQGEALSTLTVELCADDGGFMVLASTDRGKMMAASSQPCRTLLDVALEKPNSKVQTISRQAVALNYHCVIDMS